MQISRAATSRANGKFPCKMRLRSGGKRRRFFVSHMDPLNLLVGVNRVRDAVERMARNSVNLPDSCFGKNIHQQICYFFLGHDYILSDLMKEDLTFCPLAWFLSIS